ncbi:hypothetical protein GLOIN_2v1543156, partial [Rhizophagus irregularis DAOM 181602=DAOM 197198]
IDYIPVYRLQFSAFVKLTNIPHFMKIVSLKFIYKIYYLKNCILLIFKFVYFYYI